MVKNQTCWNTINNLCAFFTISFYTASHQTIVILSIFQEIPKSFFSTIVFFNHFMWKDARFFISNEHFFRLESRQFLDTFINISTNEIAITTMHFCIGFFNKSNPHFVDICTCSKYRFNVFSFKFFKRRL